VWGNNVVWGQGLIGMSLDEDDNIVWGNTLDEDDNIVWGNLNDECIVWGNLYGVRLVSGSSLDDDDNIVWGNAAELGNVTTWIRGVVKSSHNRARRSAAKRGVN